MSGFDILRFSNHVPFSVAESEFTGAWGCALSQGTTEEQVCRVSSKPSSVVLRSQSTAPERFDYIDALRGIAVLGVILVHSAILSQQGSFPEMMAFTGQRGVQLFYMVSAFTLFLTLDSGRKEHYRWSNFYIRRFFRIAPLFYLAIIANLLLNGRVISVNPHVELSWLQVLSGFLFLHGLNYKTINGVAIGGWSIAVESTFYLFVPYFFTTTKTLRQAISLFIAGALIFGTISWEAAAHYPYMRHYFSFLWFPVEFPVFALGIVAYTVWKQYIKPACRMGEAQLPRELSMLLILASGVLYATYCQVLYVGRQPYDDEGLYLSSFLFLPLILGLSLHPWKFFVNGFTKFMGKISFSVYLCHFFVIRIVENLLDRLDKLPSVFAMAYLRGTPLGLVVVFLVVLAISIPLCMFTWKFVEQPGIRFGKRWIRRREERAAALCA